MTDREMLDLILQKMVSMERQMATKQGLTEIRSSMATKEELTGIKASMATKEELAEIKAGMATKEDIANLDARMDSLDAKLEYYAEEQQKDILHALKRIEDKYNHFDAKLDVLTHHYIEQAAEIRLLKKAR